MCKLEGQTGGLDRQTVMANKEWWITWAGRLD